MKNLFFTLAILFTLLNANAQNVYNDDPYKSHSVRVNYFMGVNNPKILLKDADGNLIKELSGVNDKLNGGLAYYYRVPMAKKTYYQFEGRFNILSAKFDTDEDGTTDESFHNIFDIELGIIGGKYVVSNMLSVQLGALAVMKDFPREITLEGNGDFVKKNSFWFAGGPVAGAEFKINNIILLSARYNHYFNNQFNYTQGENATKRTAQVKLSPGYLELGLGLKF